MDTITAPRPRIAVIAIHGVADQKPSDTVRTAAKLLAGTAGGYGAFDEHSLRISVERVPTNGRASAPGMLKEVLGYKVQSRTVADQVNSATPARNGDVSLEYMEELLEPYQVNDEDAIYETLRIEGTRTSSGADVDLYEMYWADLSRFVGNWVRWLIEFYQLLFDLSILGRKSLEFARGASESGMAANNAWRFMWAAFANSQITAERSLSLFVPVSNLYLLGIALSVLPLVLVQEPSIAVGVKWVVTIAAALAAAFLGYLVRTVSSGRRWPWVAVVPLLVVGLGYLSIHISKPSEYLWLMVTWWVLPLAGILVAMWFYQKSHPGAFLTTLIVGAAVTARYLYVIWSHSSTPQEVIDALMNTAEWLLLANVVAWSLLYGASFIMTLIGWIIGFSVTKGAQRNAVWRAAWTANLTMVLPGVLVLILTLSLWQALISLGTLTAGKDPSTLQNRVSADHLWQTSHVPCWGNALCQNLLYDGATDSRPVVETVRFLFKASQTPPYCIALVALAFAVGLLVWTIIPAVVAELFARRMPPGSTRRDDASKWLGESLSAGFRAMRFSGEIVRFVFILLMPIGAIIFWIYHQDLTGVQDELNQYNSLFGFLAGWLVLALIASKGPFRGLALGLRSALDIALDVINWLRIFPQKSNCRGRICARFYSLLRHVQDWQSRTDGRGYDAVVILSHSQGTVIAADLLRYLTSKGLRPRLPVYLFTMGCPLRQLYGLRFPHIYGWARMDHKLWPTPGPNPDELGVELWVNAYTSGDYVGRYLWYPDDGALHDRWSIDSKATRTHGRMREFCVGAGAHTHYWDGSAPAVAVELDRLVALAAAELRDPNRAD